MKMAHALGAIAAAGLFATASYADKVLQFDINSLTAYDSGGTFDENYTGSITLEMDGNSALAAILINGSNQPIASGQLGDFNGQIDIMNGVVTGGSFTIESIAGEMYSATIITNSGNVTASAGQTGPFTIDGLTFQGFFSNLTGGTMFAGVDVSDWVSANGVSGSFLEIKFNGGMDTDTDIDIFVVVPLPAPFGLASAGLLGLVAIRRRR